MPDSIIVWIKMFDVTYFVYVVFHIPVILYDTLSNMTLFNKQCYSVSFNESKLLLSCVVLFSRQHNIKSLTKTRLWLKPNVFFHSIVLTPVHWISYISAFSWSCFVLLVTRLPMIELLLLNWVWLVNCLLKDALIYDMRLFIKYLPYLAHS